MIGREMKLNIEYRAAIERGDNALMLVIERQLLDLSVLSGVKSGEVVALSPLLPDGTREWSGVFNPEDQ